MSSRKARLLSLFLGLFASLILLGGCNSAEEAVLLDVQVDSTWTRYDRVMVVLADSTGRALDTLFNDRLQSTGQLGNLDGSGYDGGSIQVILVGFLENKIAKRETRPFDGRTGLSGEKLIVVLIPLDGPDRDTTLDLKPDAAKIYTGGPDLTLAPAGKDWAGKTLEWSSASPVIATVSNGKVRPVAPGKTWIRAVSSHSRDSSEITVVTDTPVLDAGQDSVILTGSTLAFRIGVRQEFGVIDMFKWSLDGDALWDDSISGLPSDASSLTTPSRTYSKVGTVNLQFFVRDGEGNTALTTRRLIVRDPDLPVIASFRPSDTTVSIRDSIGFSARITSKVSFSSYSWDFGDDGRAEVSGDLSDTAAALSAGRRYPDTGSFPVLLKVTDTKGGVATRRATVRVTLDLPIADAGPDTTVAAGTRVHLQGKAADGLGKVVKTEWKIGSTAFAVASPDTQFTAPASGQVLPCVFRVTDDDGGVAMDTVQVNVSPYGNAALVSLKATAGALSPAFAAGTLAYTVHTKDIVTYITATVLAGNPATLKVNGAVVASGSSSAAIRLSARDTTLVTVEVTAQDGTTRTYTVTFIVETTGQPDLTISATDVTYKTVRGVEYSYTLRNQGTAPIPDLFNVSIQNFYSADTLFNNPGDVAAGGAILGIRRALAAGDSLTGIFQASGSIPAGLRYLTFKVDWGDSVEESDENNNTAYRLVLVPPVAQAGVDTTVAAASSIRLRGRASDPIGSVVKTEWKIGAAAYVTASPETTFTAPAAGGSMLVCLFRVTDDDGLVDEDTVRITVSASVDADLSALVPSAGTLSPAFSRATTAYTLSVANSVTSMTLTPTATSAAATIRVNGVVVAGGAASGNLALAVGANILTVAVTAQSGLVKTYTVTATREGTTLPDLVITSAAITSITASSVNYSYTIRNDGGTTIPDLWSVSIQNFYSNDQIFNNTGDAAAGGSILGARRSLAPGESYSGTYQASGAPDAFQYVTWKIDWGDAVAESNENNNTVAMPIR